MLKFENLEVGKLPKEIGDLIHLRLFSLRGSHVKKVPSSIGNLRCLETLDSRLRDLYGFPRQLSRIYQLEQLRNLYLRTYFGSMLRLDNLIHLQTIVGIKVKYHFLDSLEKLTNLTKLIIHLWPDFRGTRIRFNNLRSLTIFYYMATDHTTEFIENVKSVILSCPQIYKLHLKVNLLKLPEANQFSPNLTKLTLIYRLLKDDPMVNIRKATKFEDPSPWSLFIHWN